MTLAPTPESATGPRTRAARDATPFRSRFESLGQKLPEKRLCTRELLASCRQIAEMRRGW